MSIRLTGVKERPIGVLQGRLDVFFASSRSFECLQGELVTLVGQECALEDIPAREDRVQAVLFKMLGVAGGLQADAQRVEEKTDEKHIHKYFKLRDGPWYDPKQYRYMDWQHKEPLQQVHQITCQISSTDYKGWVAQFQRESEQRREGALIALEFQNIDQTFPSCRHTLISANPREYLRLSVLYREKLCQQDKPEAVVSFGKEWMKSLPQEASWEDVEAMSFYVLGAAQQAGDADLTDYLGDLQLWVERHPPSESSSVFPAGPDQATSYWGRSTYILGLFHLNKGSPDLSSQALHLYQNCSLLYPNQPHWGAAQALCHISRRQWVEAKAALAELPSDAPLVLHAQTLLNKGLKKRIISAGFDFSVLALSRLVPARYCKTSVFDVTLSAVQLLANASFRNEWLPYLWDRLQQQTTIRPPLLSAALIVQDVVDCVFRNFRPLKPFQRRVSLESHALRLGHAAFATYSHPELLTVPTAINLGSLLLSASQVYDEDTSGSPVFRALRSTTQKILSDASAMTTAAAYPDLLPLVGIQPPKTEKLSPKGWFLLGIGSSTIYRFYYYPYLWAACVMQDAHKLCSQQKYEEAIDALTAAESSIFAGWFKSATQSYANYVRGLQQYGEGHITYAVFLMHLNQALEALKQSFYYDVVCKLLLATKVEIAIQRHDQTALEEVFEENPSSATRGFDLLLHHIFQYALQDQVAACRTLHEMRSSFPPQFHPFIDTFGSLLQTHASFIQNLSQLSLSSLLRGSSSSDQAQQWTEAATEFQSFFSKHVEKKDLYQALQYRKLIIAFATDEPMEAFFQESDASLHRQFSHDLILTGPAINTLQRTRSSSFVDDELIQNYSLFLSLQKDAPAEEKILALKSCSALLDVEKEFHRELHALFCAYQMAIYLDSEMWAEARALLTQEATNVHTEIAAYLFHRMYVSAQQGNEVVGGIQEIINNLDPWPQLELFKAFLAYLHPSTQLEGATALIELLPKTAQLSTILANLQCHQKVLLFKLYLSQKSFDSAKDLLIPSDVSYPELCKILFMFLLDTGEQLRQTRTLTTVQERLHQLNHFFAIPDSDVIQNYVYFLTRLEKAQKQGRLEVYQETGDSLSALCDQLRSTYGFVPESLNTALAHIYLNIAVLAKQTGNRELSSSAVAFVQQLGFHVDDRLYQGLLSTL